MNDESSRSHSILMLKLQSTFEEGNIKIVRNSKLSLIDLAGSENQRINQLEGDRKKESSNINKSLLQLGIVINKLYENSFNNNNFISYRSSKLTHLLKDSLGGNSKTSIIACISPCLNKVKETLSTLQFADRAKQIKCNVHVNEDKEAINDGFKELYEKLYNN